MGNGDTPGFFRVIGEIRLGEQVGVLADDLDRLLVRTDGSVGADAPEFAGCRARRGRREFFAHFKGGIADIVDDAHREGSLGAPLIQIFVNGLHHGRREILTAEPVPSADDKLSGVLFQDRRADLQVQGLSNAHRGLEPVENGYFLDRPRQNLEEVLPGEGKVKPDLDEAELGPPRVQIIDGPFNDVAARSHGDDDFVRFGMAHVIKEVIGSSGQFADLSHFLFHDARQFRIIGRAGFAVLKKDIGALRCAAHLGMLRIHGPGPEAVNGVPVHESGHVGVLDQFDLLDDHGGPEPVKAMDEWEAGLDARQMGDQPQVHDLLGGSRGEEGKSRLTDRIDVRVVPENAEGLAGDGSGRHMEDRRQQFTGDLVHVRLHEQKALRRREGRGKRPRRQRAVNRGCRPSFGLHFHDFKRLAEDVLFFTRGPFAAVFPDGARRRNRIDRRHFAHRVSHMRGYFISFQGFIVSAHFLSLSRR
ncbi:MAG: hypothetical protein A4E70_02570 [Syntrophus sp. PtaU1.Bin005]|nr:MAG: hypothetical protein A4E70_02570 [Syntrophus sp. PtaU1.Bin005]